MLDLSLIPYYSIKNRIYEDVTISVRDIDFLQLTYVEGHITYSFTSCFFRKLIIENPTPIPFKDVSFAFLGCYIEEIQINSLVSKNISIGFYGSIVSGKIENKNLAGVDFNNCLSKGIFLTTIPKITLSYTKENLHLYRWRKLLRKVRGTFSDLRYLRNSYYISECPHVGLTSNFLKSTSPKRFKLNIDLQYSDSSNDTSWKFAGLDMDSLSLSGRPNGDVSFENLYVNSLYIYDCHPENEISFYNIAPSPTNKTESKIGIHKSNLDNVWFDNVEFAKYDRISLYRSKLSKAIFTSCNFPSSYSTFEKFMPIENVHYPESRGQNHHKDQYEIFLQLKRSLEGTGNYYEGQNLQAIAHEALKKVPTISLGDKIILCMNQLTNNHGQAIGRPFLLFLASSITFYLLYLLSLGRLFNSNDFDPSLAGYYFAYIDITHRTDFLVDKSEFTFWSLFFDYAGKILLGYLIYQFVAAFRKYGKK